MKSLKETQLEMKAKWITLKQNTLTEDDSLNLKTVDIVVVENMNAVKSVQQFVKTAKDVERRIILNVCVNLVQAITMQTITAITNRSEVNRADSEGNQLSEGDFKGNIQENQKGNLWIC